MQKKISTNLKTELYHDIARRGSSTDRAVFETYQAFMAGYVRRVNEATLNVTIGGVRIGSAKRTRLAQINLKSRIITFSRFAIENVPERGRRYLVIHELAHVKEPSHNKRFWQLVEKFEPDYRQIDKSLDVAFKRNVIEATLLRQPLFKQDAEPYKDGLELPVHGPLTDYLVGSVNESHEVNEGFAKHIASGRGDLESREEYASLNYDLNSGVIFGGSCVDCGVGAADYEIVF